MIRFNAFVIFVAILVGCGAAPTVAINLESLLIQSGDLPAGVTGAQVKNVAPPAFKQYPAATTAIDQRFQRDGGVIGGVVVLLYESAADRDAAWALSLKGLGNDAQVIDGLGEQARLANLPIVNVAFRRCRAIVDVRMSDAARDDVITYAKRLDARLQAAVC